MSATDLAFIHERIVSSDAETQIDDEVRQIYELVEPDSVVADDKTLTLGLAAPDPAWPDRIHGIVPHRHRGRETWNAPW